jgi:hypothetical protein
MKDVRRSILTGLLAATILSACGSYGGGSAPAGGAGAPTAAPTTAPSAKPAGSAMPGNPDVDNYGY